MTIWNLYRSKDRVRVTALIKTGSSGVHLFGIIGRVVLTLGLWLAAIWMVGSISAQTTSGYLTLASSISTVVGNGTAGYSGDNGAAATAELSAPSAIALDANGDLYIADSGNNRIRKVDGTTGSISTVAGNGTAGYSGDGVLASSAEMSSPSGIAVDSAGNLYIA